MATKAKAKVKAQEGGTLDDDDDALDVGAVVNVDEQLAHRWNKKVRRPKRGPHVAAHPERMPTDATELERCLADAEWRLFSGCLYQIIVKGDPVLDAEGNEVDEGESFVMPFKPNRAQKRFIRRLWHRNLILKARQLGFTTLIAIMWLDHALFNGNQRCGMIAQDRETAEAIFRDKVVFAYDRLPEEIKERFPLARASTKELLFAHNNSSLRVATSVRGGTIHRLHVSEFGKICAKFPQKAEEVVTGSFQAVPLSGIIVVESTAEGQEGEFYEMCKRAQALAAAMRKLTASQYRFHFYAWWQEPGYTMDPAGVVITTAQHDYFNAIEQSEGCQIDLGQRAWYVEKAKNEFEGREERMWREYPSSPEESFQQSVEGNYYAKDIVLLRKRGGICQVPTLDLPVYTFWDIGRSDGTAVWFAQFMRDGAESRFISYYEEHGEDLRHYARMLQEKGYLYGGHFLPHDANNKVLSDYNRSVREQLQDLMPGQAFWVVPKITELMTGIFATRKHLKSAFFDLDGTREGVERITGYKKKYSHSENRFIDQPDKSNGCTEGADALRQWAQAKENGLLDSALSSGSSSYTEAPAPMGI